MKKTINYFVAAGVAATILTLGGCSKKDNALPAIGGFNSSADIEASALVGYWPFENDFKESVQGLAPTPSAVAAPTFTTGVKGQAYQGHGDSYVSYPLGTLGGVQSVTISMWVKPAGVPIPNGTGSYISGHGAQGIFHLYNATGSFYVMEAEMEQFLPVKSTNDSLKFNMGFQSDNSGQYGPHEGVTPGGYLTNSINKWTHLVMTYDGSTSTYTMYQNGAVIGVQSAWSDGKTAVPVVILNGEVGKGAPLGNLALTSPIGLVVGAFPQRLNLTADGLGSNDFGGNWQGGLDELRVYKAALTQAEVGALYSLELAGR